MRSFFGKYHKAAVAIFFIVLVSLTSRGAAPYYFDKWDTDNGLPQNTVGSIIQTSDGYLWLATLDGLVRFDGVKFRVFTTGNSEGLSSNRLRLLYETPDGTLWIGTEESGVTSYKKGAFRTFTREDGLPHESALGFGTDTDGSLLVTSVAGIAKFNGERFEKLNTDALPDTRRTCAARGGGLWVIDPDGLHRFKNNVVEKRSFGTFQINLNDIPVCYEDKEGKVWVVAGGFEGIISVQNGSVMRFGAENGFPDKTNIFFIGESRGGDLWLGTNNGILHFSDGRFVRYGPEDGLADKNFISFYEDREGNIWFGSLFGGLGRLSRRAIVVLTMRDGLAGNSVYPIYEARDGAIWIGANGLTRIRNGEVTAYTSEKYKVPRDVTAIAEDDQGRLWCGTSGGVGYLQDQQFTDVKDKFAFRAGEYTVWAVHQDHTGTIWFGTSIGLVKMTGEKYETFTSAQGLAADDVKNILEDREGRLWFGTYGGLSLWQNGTFQNFTTREGLSSNRVRTLFEDEQGTIWIGTYDGGMSRFREGKFTNYSTKNGLFSDGAFQILPDDAGYFWMSSNQGIYRVRKQDLEDLAAGKIGTVRSEAYGKRDGLLNTECNGGRQPAGVRARDGRLWFPTQEGAAIVDPTAIEQNSLPPPVLIEGVTIDQKDVAIGKNILLSPDQTDLEIAYTGLSFVKPEQVRFRYKVEGLDNNWVEAGTRRTAYFSHLPPGNYTFRVTAANNSGVWNTEGASLQFTVYPPFWRTWWFAAALVLTVAVLAYLIYRRRVGTLERERIAQVAFSQKLIATQEQERKRIAGELHDGLGQNLLVIKNWTLLAQQRNTENANTEILEEINETASQTIEEVRRISYNLRPYQIDEIGLTRALEGMLKRMAAATPINLTWELDQIDGSLALENEINLFRIVQECLNNIIKHSEATEARITIKHDKNNISLRVEDNGRGFSPGDPDGRRGLGLVGIEERARMIGGSAQIRSAPGKGTTVQINISI